MAKHYKIAIIGGGSAGITVAARLLRSNKTLKNQIAIIDPAKYHYYQPLWTLVGGGVTSIEKTRKTMASVIPKNAHWLKRKVEEIDPDNNTLLLDGNASITYDYLIACPGIQINWNQIKGLEENLGKGGVCSNYSSEYAPYTWQTLKDLKKGNAVFTNPNTPIKCGGAPMKIMFLAEDYFQNHELKDNINVIYETANDKLFAVPKYRRELDRLVKERNIEVNFKHNLVEIDGENKVAIFENLNTNEKIERSYDMLHVTPPMSAPNFIKESKISNEDGWVDVDPSTLQHTKYKNIFGLGDASSSPTSKTGAAVRKQAPVVVDNLIQLMRNENERLLHHYDGYTSCPIVTGYNKLILAEFDYNNNPVETMPFNQAKERKSMYLLKKEFLPRMYWYGMLKGIM